MRLFNKNKEQEKEEDNEKECDKAICPHCNEMIRRLEVLSLKNMDENKIDTIEVIACPSCAKIIGALEY